jgi:hypothetical protein
LYSCATVYKLDPPGLVNYILAGLTCQLMWDMMMTAASGAQSSGSKSEQRLGRSDQPEIRQAEIPDETGPR